MEGEQLVERDFEFSRDEEGDFGVRDECSGLNGIDGLAADVYAPREVGGANASALADLFEPIFNAGFHW